MENIDSWIILFSFQVSTYQITWHWDWNNHWDV